MGKPMKQIANVEIIRLRAIADLLDDVQENQFDLKAWVTQRASPPITRFFGLIQTDPGCGFAGCAMGWAAHVELFPDFVFKSGKVHYRGLTDFHATAAVIGTNYSMAMYLFHPEHYRPNPTTTIVATRIRRFVTKIEAIRRRDQRRAIVLVAQMARELADA
jgi:hypothetical protein